MMSSTDCVANQTLKMSESKELFTTNLDHGTENTVPKFSGDFADKYLLSGIAQAQGKAPPLSIAQNIVFTMIGKLIGH